MEWMLMPYRKLYRLIEGRSSRQEYWMFTFFNVLVLLVVLAIMFLFASLVFGLKIGNNLPGLLLIMLATTFACSSFGLLLAGISRSRTRWTIRN